GRDRGRRAGARILHRIPVDLTCTLSALPTSGFGLRLPHARSNRPSLKATGLQAIGDARRHRLPRRFDAVGYPWEWLAAGRTAAFAPRAAAGAAADRTATASGGTGKSGPDQ